MQILVPHKNLCIEDGWQHVLTPIILISLKTMRIREESTCWLKVS